MARPLPKYRKIIISNLIDNGTANDVLTRIMEINADDDEKENEYKDWERKPIKLFINSLGGSVYDGLAIYDIIKQSKTPVYTICLGSAMSMGLWIWMAGQKRLIGEHATLMFHDISTWASDKTEGIKQELTEMQRLQEISVKTITSQSLVKEKQLRDYITRKAEWYIPPEKAIELKLAHGYYKGDEYE